jgi:hypothetical protein
VLLNLEYARLYILVKRDVERGSLLSLGETVDGNDGAATVVKGDMYEDR